MWTLKKNTNGGLVVFTSGRSGKTGGRRSTLPGRGVRCQREGTDKAVGLEIPDFAQTVLITGENLTHGVDGLDTNDGRIVAWEFMDELATERVPDVNIVVKTDTDE